MNNYEKGFIKRAGEANLLPEHAKEVFEKIADGFLSGAWNVAKTLNPATNLMGLAAKANPLAATGIKERAALGTNNLLNNRYVHGLAGAGNAVADMFGMGNGGGYQGGFNQSMQRSNQAITLNQANLANNYFDRGYIAEAQKYQEQAAQRAAGGYLSGAQSYNDVGEALGQFKGKQEALDRAAYASSEVDRQGREQMQQFLPGYKAPAPVPSSGNSTQHDWGIQRKAPSPLNQGYYPEVDPTSFSSGAPPRSSLELLRNPYGK